MLLIVFNSLIYPLIEKKTNYLGNTQGDTYGGVLIILVLLFGPLLFLFIKPLKRYQKLKYLENRIRYYKWCGFINSDDKGIRRMERIYKIEKLHQKTKIRKIKNNIKQYFDFLIILITFVL